MSSSRGWFVFRPVAVTLTVVATGLTIALPMLQFGAWISENAVWALWVVIAVLVVAMLFVVAHLAAVKERMTDAKAATGVERQAAEQAVKDAGKARAALEVSKLAALPTDGFSKPDQALAEHLFEYSSNPKTLKTLSSFFPYAIPRETAGLLDELAELPMTRTAHDAELAQHLDTLAEAAGLWRSKLLPLTSWDGDNYTTKLDHHVSEEAYKRHDERTGVRNE